eukprot:TRINITY_DN72976_c0_g1_i1.p1 TRINITY_DN72976_c0_g1~~TRINITY_DN72976_c0_g1_i1.p1  ORF type:complete len:584 (+),score=83.00 TRINITY_DN72976_c0_g1_i1:100-1851(+)
MPEFKYVRVDVTDPDKPLDDEHREKLLDGLPSYRAREVDWCIATARSLLTVSLSGAMLLLARLLFSLNTSEAVLQFKPALVMNCSSGSAMLSTEHEADSQEFWKVLGNTKAMWLRFNLSTGSIVTFYKNEEVYQLDPSLWRALSFGLMPQAPLQFYVYADDDMVACVQDDRGGLDDKYGAALLASLARVRRNKVIYASPGNPVSFNGGMLIRDDFARFESKQGVFKQSGTSWQFLLKPWSSPGWKSFIILVVIAIALLTCLAFADIAMRCFSAWDNAVNDWIVQYDHLWHANELPKNTSSRPVDAQTSHEESNNDCPLSFAHHISRLTFCSPYFIADAILDDVWKVSASWSASFKGTCIAWLMLLIPTIPLLALGLFCAWLRIYLAYGWTIYWTSAAVLGILYNFSASQCIRRPCIFFLLLIAIIFTLVGLAYTVMLLLFLLVRLVTQPKEVIGLVVPVISIVAYVVIAVQQLTDVQKHFKAQQSGKARKGVVYTVMDEFGLSEKWLVVTVVGTVTLLVLLILILAMGAIMWTENVESAGKNPIPAVVVPVTAYIQCANQVENLKQKTQSAASEVTNVANAIL